MSKKQEGLKGDKKEGGDRRISEMRAGVNLTAPLSGQNFTSLKPADKDALLKSLLLRFGMIDAEGKVK